MNNSGYNTYIHQNLRRKLHVQLSLKNKKCHFFFFYKIGEQKGGTGPVWGLVRGRGKMWGKGTGGEYGGNMMDSCLKMEK
jgi:hypothetical protein